MKSNPSPRAPPNPLPYPFRLEGGEEEDLAAFAVLAAPMVNPTLSLSAAFMPLGDGRLPKL